MEENVVEKSVIKTTKKLINKMIRCQDISGQKYYPLYRYKRDEKRINKNIICLRCSSPWGANPQSKWRLK